MLIIAGLLIECNILKIRYPCILNLQYLCSSYTAPALSPFLLSSNALLRAFLAFLYRLIHRSRSALPLVHQYRHLHLSPLKPLIIIEASCSTATGEHPPQTLIVEGAFEVRVDARCLVYLGL